MLQQCRRSAAQHDRATTSGSVRAAAALSARHDFAVVAMYTQRLQ